MNDDIVIVSQPKGVSNNNFYIRQNQQYKYDAQWCFWMLLLFDCVLRLHAFLDCVTVLWKNDTHAHTHIQTNAQRIQCKKERTNERANEKRFECWCWRFFVTVSISSECWWFFSLDLFMLSVFYLSKRYRQQQQHWSIYLSIQHKMYVYVWVSVCLELVWSFDFYLFSFDSYSCLNLFDAMLLTLRSSLNSVHLIQIDFMSTHFSLCVCVSAVLYSTSHTKKTSHGLTMVFLFVFESHINRIEMWNGSRSSFYQMVNGLNAILMFYKADTLL